VGEGVDGELHRERGDEGRVCAVEPLPASVGAPSGRSKLTASCACATYMVKFCRGQATSPSVCLLSARGGPRPPACRAGGTADGPRHLD
jgi:hypothetical protein